MTHKYADALAIGTAAEGVIKCSWAAIYDSTGKRIFTLQNRNFSRETIVPVEDQIWDKSDPGDVNMGTYALNLAWTTDRLFEPVVVARNYHYDYRVPVELTPNAKVAMLNILKLKKAWWERKTADPVLAERFAKMAAQTQKTIDYITNLTTVYVKPKAFVWYPLNTFAIDGADVEAAKRAYDQSKKLLAVSAATIIL